MEHRDVLRTPLRCGVGRQPTGGCPRRPPPRHRRGRGRRPAREGGDGPARRRAQVRRSPHDGVGARARAGPARAVPASVGGPRARAAMSADSSWTAPAGVASVPATARPRRRRRRRAPRGARRNGPGGGREAAAAGAPSSRQAPSPSRRPSRGVSSAAVTTSRTGTSGRPPVETTFCVARAKVSRRARVPGRTGRPQEQHGAPRTQAERELRGGRRRATLAATPRTASAAATRARGPDPEGLGACAAAARARAAPARPAARPGAHRSNKPGRWSTAARRLSTADRSIGGGQGPATLPAAPTVSQRVARGRG